MISFDLEIFDKSQWRGAYIVGGSVRDLLLGRTPLDFDIAVPGNVKRFAKRLAAQMNGHLVEMGKEEHMIYRVVVDKKIFDFSPVNGGSIEEDLKNRDFTINAMAYDFSSQDIIDCVGGMQDLDNKNIRMVSGSVFERDPVRLIRAYRLGATLECAIDSRTIATIKKDAGLISNSAGERIRTELFKILETPESRSWILQMADSGLLFTVFPELAALKACTQNRYHRFDVFEHTLRAFHHLEKILNNPGDYLAVLSGVPTQWTDKNRAVLLKYAMLLHDIGKPRARTADPHGNIHFYGHGKKSADMAKEINQRLKLSNHDSEYTDFIVRKHIRPIFLFIARQQNKISRKAITRFFMKCGTRAPDLLLHALADICGKGDENDERNAAFIDFCRKMITHYYSDFRPQRAKPPLITGTDLIKTFGLKPSPLFKKILTNLEEARLSGSIRNKSEAEAWIRHFLARNKA
ncbi:MAG: CCA tRNA nucleotidyltransferase [Deltaproteobacteria bacterium]|nr:MAG: CCA tRNA nucleotidyltransferase [Deltaproteobacteria bacterium]